MTRTAINFFLMILGSSLLSALLGGLFALLIATVSPEFVSGLFFLDKATNVSSYAFAVGMVLGLGIGGVVSAFACTLTAILKVIRLRVEHTTVPKS